MKCWRHVAFSVLIFWLGLAALSLQAEPMSSFDVRTAVTGWLKLDSRPLDMPLGRHIKAVIPFADDRGQTNYYAVELAPAGLVIVSADDEVEPIVAFASCGRYDPSPRHSFGALVSRDLPGRMAAARQRRATLAPGIGADPVSESQRGKWRFLKNSGASALAAGEPSIQFSVSDVRVAPLVQSAWDQSTDGSGNCYNYFTPNNYVCGCGATALAQLMRYHCHPSAGVGARSFDIAVDGVAQSRTLLGGNGSGGPYHWELMPLDPGSTTTETERQHIGALCHDAGVAGHASYSSDATSMYLPDMAESLLTVFQYSQAVQGAGDGGDIGAGLITMINPNLDAGLPVILGIYGDVGGHAVIADGYGYQGGSLYHHINLGWGAYDAVENAWYALPIVDPMGVTFTTVNFCIYNLAPVGSGEIISGRITDSVGNPLSGALVMAVHSSGAAYTDYSDSRGIYALAGVPSSSSFVVLASLQGYSFSAQSISTGHSSDFEVFSGNCWAVDFLATAAYAPASMDYDGDGKADPALYADAEGLWGIWLSSENTNHLTLFQFGGGGCVPATADYDGDGKADPALFQASSGFWGVMLSGRDYALSLVEFGLGGTAAAPGDYDADSKADPAVYAAPTTLWGAMLSSRAYTLTTAIFGEQGYEPVQADYDGDGKTDPALYSKTTGIWGVLLSANGYLLATASLGGTGYTAIPSDFDGDGRADPAVYHDASGLWGIMLSSQSYALVMAQLGGAGYRPAPADYSGDSRADPAVYQESSGVWHIQSDFGRAPAAPTDVAASPGTYTNKVLINWMAIGNALGYEILRGTTDQTNACVIQGSSPTNVYNDEETAPGVLYYYWIRATNSFGASALSASGAGYCAVTSLSAPANVAASDGVYTNKIRVTWSLVSGANTYQLFRALTANSNELSYAGSTNVNRFDDFTAERELTYYYRVSAAALGGITSALSSADSGYLADTNTSGQADLQLSNFIFLPAAYSTGDYPTVVSLRLTNNGPADLETPNTRLAVDFYLSRNTTLGDSDDLYLGIYADDKTLLADNFTSLTFSASDRQSLAIPASASGSYYVFAKVRHAAPSTLVEPNDANNHVMRNGAITVD